MVLPNLFEQLYYFLLPLPVGSVACVCPPPPLPATLPPTAPHCHCHLANPIEPILKLCKYAIYTCVCFTPILGTPMVVKNYVNLYKKSQKSSVIRYIVAQFQNNVLRHNEDKLMWQEKNDHMQQYFHDYIHFTNRQLAQQQSVLQLVRRLT